MDKTSSATLNLKTDPSCQGAQPSNPNMTLKEFKRQIEQQRSANQKESYASWVSHPENRFDLKRQLFRERAIYGTVSCPICKQELERDGFDMHEVFLTRGDVQGCSDEVKEMIMVPQNCVLVHTIECHVKAADLVGKVLCARQLLVHEGYGVIKNWLAHMEAALKGSEARIAQLYLDAITEGVFETKPIIKESRVTWDFRRITMAEETELNTPAKNGR
jgi:hypothetical protein